MPQEGSSPVPADAHSLPQEREQRIAKARKLAELGRAPYGRAFARTGTLAEVRAAFEPGRVVRVAGRLMTIRNMGKSVFADLRDGTDRFQVFASRQQMGEEPYDVFKLLDTGDHIGVEGELMLTRTGEQTVRVDKWTMLSKALLPLPEKWHGIKDPEARYRRRYLDLISNPEVRARFDLRSRIVRELRSFLWSRGYTEVETPMMQPAPGGALARPFETHYSALNASMYLRIAPELYLKRLLVGGYDRVFELNRNFRNEGLSKTHNPEFTMLEAYEAYSDMRGMMRLVQDMILHVARTVKPEGPLEFGSGDQRVDMAPPWREAAYRDLIVEKMGPDWYELDRARAGERAAALGLDIAPQMDLSEITHEVYEKAIEKTLMAPTFVTRLPREFVPLARTCEDDESVVDVYELVIQGKEISPGYSELNDPLDQRRRFEAQVGKERHRMDEDFLAALEQSMPPAGGMGLGVDRLVMILAGSEAIRDVILFPQLRQKPEAVPDAAAGTGER
ncbi:MAG: lysine--tRNA ligase [Lentisphaerae bacterium]|nr:lysine--tRNA ligase [Lentisphaerota bacterium]